jgi:hypothetical protein
MAMAKGDWDWGLGGRQNASRRVRDCLASISYGRFYEGLLDTPWPLNAKNMGINHLFRAKISKISSCVYICVFQALYP